MRCSIGVWVFVLASWPAMAGGAGEAVRFQHDECVAEISRFADASNLDDLAGTRHTLLLCLAEASVARSSTDRPIDRAAPGDAFYKLYPARQAVETGTDAAAMIVSTVPVTGVAWVAGTRLACGDTPRGQGGPIGPMKDEGVLTSGLSPRLTIDLEAFSRLSDADAARTKHLLEAVRAPSAPAPLTALAKLQELMKQNVLDQDAAITGTVTGTDAAAPLARLAAGVNRATVAAGATKAADPPPVAVGQLAADCCCNPPVPTLVRGIGAGTVSPKLEVPVDWLMGGLPQNFRQ